MESDEIRVELVPGIGGKIVSMLYKPTGREWLLDAGGRELLPSAPGSTFGMGDMSGWDECFPSIDPCRAGKEGLSGIPDHGEVWSAPWGYSIVGGSLSCWVNGRSLPYRLTRTLTFTAANAIRMDYSAYNHGREPFSFLWVPHPQFAVPEPMRVILPASVQKVLCVFGGATRTAGNSYEWTGESTVPDRKTGDARKYYVQGIHSDGWCSLMGDRSGDWLGFKVDPRRVPYLGIWIDEGMFNDRNAVALEPSIGYYDSLDRACLNGTSQTVLPGETWEWTLHLELGTGGSAIP
ncbi:hypothetical protein [Gorillibacterium sp. sgz5001074]|uniref:hypothetical protein n=1 Tax=Gorillibacterium sp. sgz5001074 TaxID=3446695 RepID=UPI003F676DFA